MVISNENDVVEVFHETVLFSMRLLTLDTTSGNLNVGCMAGRGRVGPVGGHLPPLEANTVVNNK